MKHRLIVLIALLSVELWATPLHTDYRYDKATVEEYQAPRLHEFRNFQHQKHTIKKHVNRQLSDRNHYTKRRHSLSHKKSMRGYRDYKKSWLHAYKHQRAHFYDNEGYYYGYFNHRGYTVDGKFYRYDRYYTYRDRVRGKGLFCHKYFKPLRAHYGYLDRSRTW